KLRGLDDVLVAWHFFFRRVDGIHDRLQPLAELDGFRAQLLVGQRADLGLESVDLMHGGDHSFHVALVLRAEYGCQYFVDHRESFFSELRRKERLSSSKRERAG